MFRFSDIPSASLLLGVGLLSAGPAFAQEVRAPAPTHEQTARAVAACGVPPGNIGIAYEDELQSDVVTITDLGGTGKARIGCVKAAVHPAYVVMIGDEDQRIAYYSADLVRPVPRRSRAAVRRQLASIADGCGLPARALLLDGTGRLRIQPSPDERYEALDCALTRLKASGLLRRMPMGFVGNETHDTGTPQ
jgi:hypothetical protein